MNLARNKRTRREVKQQIIAPREKAQGYVEYELFLVFVTVVVIVVNSLPGQPFGRWFRTLISNTSLFSRQPLRSVIQ
jgi:hypothetical protein